MKKTIIISLGGSLVSSERNILATRFILDFKKLVFRFLSQINFLIIIGGGKICRFYQTEAKKQSVGKEQLDQIGIFTSRLNAVFVKSFWVAKHIQRFC